MNTTEKQKFAELVTAALAYYNKDASPFVIQVWWTALESFELEQVSKALTSHLIDAEKGLYAPKIADMARVLQGTTTDRATLAWGKAFGALSSVGAYSDVVFDDPAIHAAIVDCGGWVKMCRSDLDELSYLQHRFCASHKAYSGRGQFEYQRMLVGDHGSESDFAKRGLKPPRPAIIGDVEKARAVYRGGQIGGKTPLLTDLLPKTLTTLGAT